MAGGDGGIELSEFVNFLVDGPAALDLEASANIVKQGAFQPNTQIAAVWPSM